MNGPKSCFRDGRGVFAAAALFLVACHASLAATLTIVSPVDKVVVSLLSADQKAYLDMGRAERRAAVRRLRRAQADREVRRQAAEGDARLAPFRHERDGTRPLLRARDERAGRRAVLEGRDGEVPRAAQQL